MAPRSWTISRAQPEGDNMLRNEFMDKAIDLVREAYHVDVNNPDHEQFDDYLRCIMYLHFQPIIDHMDEYCIDQEEYDHVRGEFDD